MLKVNVLKKQTPIETHAFERAKMISEQQRALVKNKILPVQKLAPTGEKPAWKR